ncbi:MAG: hypothetical protein Pars2KO_16010 [Parasphingorhabdus sp.]
MKTWMKVVLGIFAGIAVLLGLVFWLTGDITKAGDDFFAAAANEDIDAAYELLSEDFQAGTSKDQLAGYLKINALDNVADTSWSSRSINGNQGTLEGSVTSATGGTVPLTIDLIKSDAGWKIRNIKLEKAGFSDNRSSGTMPSETEQTQLIVETSTAFVASLKDGNMKGFHNYVSGLWQSQIDPAGLEEVFENLFPVADQLVVLGRLRPLLSKPAQINSDGLLVLEGYYDTKPSRVTFRQTYIYEGTGWRVFGLSFHVVPLE